MDASGRHHDLVARREFLAGLVCIGIAGGLGSPLARGGKKKVTSRRGSDRGGVREVTRITRMPGSGRPFAAPVTTQTFNVPGSIDATGATDVYAALNDWIDGTVTDGSIIQFPAGGIYKLSKGVMLGGRSNLILRLSTSEFRLTGDGSTHQSSAFMIGFSYPLQSFVGGASHITIEGGTVTGNDPDPGAPQPLRGENEQAVRSNGSSFIEITGMTVQAVSGDGAFFDGGSDFWVHDNHIITAGRNGLTLIKGQRLLAENNAYDRCGYCTFDIEPNTSTEASSDVMYRNNPAGSWGLDWISVDGAGKGADIQRVTIRDCAITGDALDLHIDNKDGINGNPSGRMADIAVIGNSSTVSGAGPRFTFRNIDGLTITGNSQPLSSGVLSSITNCTAVTNGPNP